MNDFVKYLQLWQRARIVLKIATTKLCVASTRSALGQNSNICGGTLSDFHYPRSPSKVSTDSIFHRNKAYEKI